MSVEEIPVSDETPWYIAQWPDGTWCDWEVRDTLRHMSDDYECRRVLTFDPNGYEPMKTEWCEDGPRR